MPKATVLADKSSFTAKMRKENDFEGFTDTERTRILEAFFQSKGLVKKKVISDENTYFFKGVHLEPMPVCFQGNRQKFYDDIITKTKIEDVATFDKQMFTLRIKPTEEHNILANNVRLRFLLFEQAKPKQEMNCFVLK